MRITPFLMFLVLAVALATVTGCTERRPPGARQSPGQPLVIEDHSEALVAWAQQGITGATLINVDTHDDIRKVDPEKMDKLAALFARKDWNALRAANSKGPDGLFHLGNFIYAAARLGIVREVYWVTPFAFLAATPEPQLREMLQARLGFSAEDSRSFRLQGATLTGSYQGIPLTLCGIETLPTLTSPVLLSIDVDFFPTYVQEYRSTYLDSIARLRGALQEKKYQTLATVVSYSVNGGFLSPLHRWVGEATIAALAMSSPAAKPDSRFTTLQQLDQLITANQPQAALALLSAANLPATDPARLLYHANAAFLLGDYDKTLDLVRQCCSRDRGYCFAYPMFGKKLLEKGRAEDAERFFREGYASHPAMNFGWMDYGIMFYHQQRYADAVVAFSRMRELDGPFPASFFLGNAQEGAGDHAAAFAAFNEGRENLRRDPFFKFISPIFVMPIKGAIAFFEKNGYREHADELRATVSPKK